jgi:hypothetical protein
MFRKPCTPTLADGRTGFMIRGRERQADANHAPLVAPIPPLVADIVPTIGSRVVT